MSQFIFKLTVCFESKMDILRYFGVWIIAFLSLFSLLTEPVNACSCMPSHPQTHYCDADYVIIMRVLRKSHRLVKDHLAYKIEIKKSYKMTEAAETVLKHGRLSTAFSDAMCGVNLEVGKLYVVAGRGSKLNLCNYIKEYQKMTIIERRGFSGAYRKGCKCKINVSFRGNGLEKPNTCNWSPFKKCETDFSLCVPVTYRTPEGLISQCHWRRTPPYKACLADP